MSAKRVGRQLHNSVKSPTAMGYADAAKDFITTAQLVPAWFAGMTCHATPISIKLDCLGVCNNQDQGGFEASCTMLARDKLPIGGFLAKKCFNKLAADHVLSQLQAKVAINPELSLGPWGCVKAFPGHTFWASIHTFWASILQ